MAIPPPPPPPPYKGLSTGAKIGIGCGGCASLAFMGVMGLAALGVIAEITGDPSGREPAGGGASQTADSGGEDRAGSEPEEETPGKEKKEETPEKDEEEAPEPEPEETSSEELYLEAVYQAAEEEGSGIHGKGDEWVIDLGWAVCDDIESGMTPTEVVISLERANEDAWVDPVGPIANDIVGNAQLYLCPDAGGD